MTDEQKAFKQQLGSTERRQRAAGSGPLTPAIKPQNFIYELRKQDQAVHKRAVKNKSRTRAAFKTLARGARKRIVVVVLSALALGAAADFGYWALVKDNRPPPEAKMTLSDVQQETVPTEAMRVAPSLPE